MVCGGRWRGIQSRRVLLAVFASGGACGVVSTAGEECAGGTPWMRAGVGRGGGR